MTQQEICELAQDIVREYYPDLYTDRFEGDPNLDRYTHIVVRNAQTGKSFASNLVSIGKKSNGAGRIRESLHILGT